MRAAATASPKRYLSIRFRDPGPRIQFSFLQKIRLIEAEQLRDNVAVSIRNASARWISLNSSRVNRLKLVEDKCNALFENGFWQVPTLENINADFPKGKLIGIIGPVGEGKSSFLQALLRELPLESGTIRINGTISYACQEPWVFAGSVRQNILFGQKMDRNRYDSVIESCALQKDLEQLAHGDKTVIGERGQLLSGGQKARIKYDLSSSRFSHFHSIDFRFFPILKFSTCRLSNGRRLSP